MSRSTVEHNWKGERRHAAERWHAACRHEASPARRAAGPEPQPEPENEEDPPGPDDDGLLEGLIDTFDRKHVQQEEDDDEVLVVPFELAPGDDAHTEDTHAALIVPFDLATPVADDGDDDSNAAEIELGFDPDVAGYADEEDAPGIDVERFELNEPLPPLEHEDMEYAEAHFDGALGSAAGAKPVQPVPASVAFQRRFVLEGDYGCMSLWGERLLLAGRHLELVHPDGQTVSLAELPSFASDMATDRHGRVVVSCRSGRLIIADPSTGKAEPMTPSADFRMQAAAALHCLDGELELVDARGNVWRLSDDGVLTQHRIAYDYAGISGQGGDYTWSRSGSGWIIRHRGSGVSPALPPTVDLGGASIISHGTRLLVHTSSGELMTWTDGVQLLCHLALGEELLASTLAGSGAMLGWLALRARDGATLVCELDLESGRLRWMHRADPVDPDDTCQLLFDSSSSTLYALLGRRLTALVRPG